MRKLPAVLALVGLTAAALVGCSSAGSGGCTPTPSADTSALDLVTVTGDADAKPDVEVHTPFHVTSTQYEQVITGAGTPITDNAQLVVLDISLIDGTTGKAVATSAYDGDLSRVFALERFVESVPGLSNAMHCAAAGSRVVAALAPGDIEAQSAASFGLTDQDSTIAVVDVRKVYLARADGALQYNARSGMPSVVRAPNGRPGVIVPDGAPPSDVAVEVLKKGTGDVVTGDDPVRVHYTGVLWSDKSVFDTTWDGDPKSVTLDQTVPGFQDAVKGQTVGSQILVVVPPDQGYGDKEQSGVPANSTLVFVVDILGIDAAPAQ